MVYPNRVVLNINQKYVMPIPYTQQGDTARVLTFNILDKGVPFNLTGKTVRAKIVKPDNTKCYNDLTITNATGGECDLKLTNQVLAVAGKVNCQLEIKEGDELLSTIIFTIDVEPSIDINGAVESTNEFTALLNGIIKLDEWDKYFKETSGAIEEKYTERLNGIDASLEEVATKNAPFPLYIETYDKSNELTHPKVLYFPNKWNGWKYWMAYTPYPKSNDDYENPCISVSQNGLDWVTPIGLTNPLAVPTEEALTRKAHYSDTHLVYRSDLNRLECWYRYNDKIDEKAHEFIYRRTSTDGINWTEQETLIDNIEYPTQSYYSPTVLYEDGKYRMYYVNGWSKVVYKESTDGLTWGDEVTCTCSLGGRRPWHLDIIHTDLGYEMVVTAYFKDDFSLNIQTLWYALSTDGINFGTATKILESSKKDGWDNQQIYRSSLLKIDSKYYLYYAGMNKDLRWHIGLATGSNPLNLIGYKDDGKRDFWKTIVRMLQINDKVNIYGDENLIEFKNNAGSYITGKLLNLIVDAIKPLGDTLNIKSAKMELSSEGIPRLAITQTGVGSIYLYSNKIVVGGVEVYNTGLIKIINSSNSNAVYLNSSSANVDTLKIVRGALGKSGFLESGGIILNTDNPCPEQIGAIRFNNATKKHQGFNGTSWNDLY